MKLVDQDRVQYLLTPQKGGAESYLLFSQNPKGWTIDLCFATENCAVIQGNSGLTSQHTFFYPFPFLERYYSDTILLATLSSQVHELCCVSREIMEQFLKGDKLEGPKRQMHIDSCALSLLLCVLEKNKQVVAELCDTCSFSKNPADRAKIQDAQNWIVNNIAASITIPQLAQKVGLNQCYLKKGFKEVYGQTIYDFVQEQRMTQAKVLLSKSNTTIAQVADSVGFSSANSFATAFKRIVGMQPSEWAKN